jgi:predicted glycosyltransferase
VDPHRVVSLREALLLQTVRTFRPDALIIEGLTGHKAPNVASFRNWLPASGSLVIDIDDVIFLLTTTGTAGSLDDSRSAVAVNL